MASKSFRSTERFFSGNAKDTTGEKTEQINIPEGYKLVPADWEQKPTETRSKRLQLLITPSLHEKLQDISRAEQISINEIANRAFTAYAESYLRGEDL